MLIQQRYRLIKSIGQGGFGKTFLALDETESPPSPCVVKQLSPHNQTPEALEKTRLEELGKHPQIPTLLAYFEEEQNFYLVQEFIDGINLAQLLEEQGAFSEAQIWQLLNNLLPILKFIHDRHIIHRDIKPANIIRRHLDNSLILVDFGAAKLVTKLTQYQTSTSIGSPEFVAPEQAKGKAVFASDLYSLGVTCIHLLTQIPPFDLFDVVNNCWVWRQYLTSSISESLGHILDCLLQNALSRRFQSADEVIKAIQETKEGARERQEELPTTNYQPPTTNYQLTLSSSINSVAINHQGTILASGNDHKTIALWDINMGQTIATLSAHTHAVNSVAFSPDKRILASASSDRTIKLWDINTLEEIHTLKGHSHAVKSIAFSPNGKLLASASWDKTIKLWCVNTGKLICTLTGHRLQVTAVAFSPNGDFLASSSCDRTVMIWQIPTTEPLELLSGQKTIENRPNSTLAGHVWAVLAIAFSPTLPILATAGDDKIIKLWDTNTGQVIRTFVGHSWSVAAVTFSSDGETLISGSWDKTIKLWSVSKSAEIATLSGHLDSVTTVATSPNLPLIASGSKDRTVKIWQVPLF